MERPTCPGILPATILDGKGRFKFRGGETYLDGRRIEP